MSVILSPISARRYTVGSSDDPYKKYWWVILGGFVLTGAWLCIPMMDTPVGSIRVDTGAKAGIDASSAEQSLDSADNPAGAPGSALDLSMGAAHKSKGDGGDDMASMLYQPPPEAGAAAAAGKPLRDATAASASASLAQQLKDAGKKADASGWTEKAQSGFATPHLAGGLSGIGSAGGGGSSAVAGGTFGAFGSRNADVGSVATQGLRDGGPAESAGFRALKASAGRAASPNLAGSAEAMHAGMSQAFDGAKGKAPGSIGTGAMAQANALYDAAPANLKANDPKLDTKTLPDPPMAATPQSSGQDMGQQLAMMAATLLVGGLVGGAAGQMVMMMGTMMMQQQQQQQAAAAAQQQQQTVNNRYGTHP